MVTPAPHQRRPDMTGERGTVLVTGFDPFDGYSVNPALLVATALHRRQVARCHIVGAELPTVFATALQRLDQLLARYRPVLVICLGLAAGRATLRLERVAINRDDARRPDNSGAQPTGQAVIDGAPSAYLSTLPLEAMQRAMTAAGVPTDTSQSAGSFVCNHVFFGLMHRLATNPELQGARGGFVHLPLLLGQGRPCMPLTQMVHGIRTGIRVALNIPHQTQAADDAHI
ncbi:MAG: pyroglutamyl-peptidase I [Comamonas sp. SCN 67-35]|uniref:pyroglutamyl-peptidase I n=2 Tax=unclassified Comamonas TaxID=2638500 RepID=UPI00086EA429|nr:pyroglutamyl-peptidase I [Comamonas sp.]ODU38927.1 MAG: pyroglutamyl-peptidase I [Comamonas sp. SCN 67-35]OJX02659.1 MAG: pyroglutamyl-peptidase I [Burkholderiales bacterium 66-26]